MPCLIRLFAVLGLVAPVGCSSSAPAAAAAAPHLGGVHVPPVPEDAKPPSVPLTAQRRHESGEPPSFEIPRGLSPSARGQFHVMVGGMRALHKTLEAVESDLPRHCEIARPHCRGRWRRSTEALAEVLEKLGSDWFRCRQLDPIDREAFLHRATEHYEYIMAWVDRIEDDVARHIAKEGWGESALDTWLELTEGLSRDDLVPPECED